MEHADEAETSMVSYDAKAHSVGVILLLLVYKSPVLVGISPGKFGLPIRVYLNPFDVGRAFGLFTDGSHIDLYVSRPDYACGRSLANHLENIERLKRYNKAPRDAQAKFEILPKDPDDVMRAAKVVLPVELKGMKRKTSLSQLNGAYLAPGSRPH